MMYKTTCPISYYEDRIEKGAKIELTDAEAANYASDVELLDDQPVPEPEETPEKPLEEMSAAELKAKAVELELIATGSKADLLSRITLHLASQEPAAGTTGDVNSPSN